MNKGEIQNIINEARRNDVVVSVKDNKLILRVAKNKQIDSSIIQKINDNKELIKDYLNDAGSNSLNFEGQLVATQQSDKPHRAPLSFAQERLWFIHKLQGSAQYNMPWIFKLEGRVNPTALEESFRLLIERQNILRTVIKEDNGVPYQELLMAKDWKMCSITGVELRDSQTDVNTYLSSKVNQSFDLEEDFMLKVYFIQQTASSALMLIVIHHISFDGWSARIMIQELTKLYEGIVGEKSELLPPMPQHYTDYAIWQKNNFSGEFLDRALDFWTKKLEDLPYTTIPSDFPPSALQSVLGSTIRHVMSTSLSSDVRTLSKQQGTTLFMTLLAGFKILLCRYTSQNDVSVGTAVAGRQKSQLEGLIGFFVNTIVLRNYIDSGESFREFLQRVKISTLEAYEYQDVPFEKIIGGLNSERNLASNGLFQIMFVFEGASGIRSSKLGEATLYLEDFFSERTRFDMEFSVRDNADEGIELTVTYASDIYKAETIQRLVSNYETLMREIVRDVDQILSKIPMIDSLEYGRILNDFNNTSASYPDTKSIVQLFEEQVAKSPAKIALVFGTEKITYQQLSERANHVAYYLIENGVKPGENIGLLADRGPWMIVGILGILKAQCLYVPLNLSYPIERLNDILDDAQIRHILYTEQGLYTSLNISDRIGCELNELILTQYQHRNLPYNSGHGAYIMYTSGSTGSPKGIKVSQKNIIKLVYEKGEIAINENDSVIQWSNYAFDGSTYEIFNTLLVGARLYLIEELTAQDADNLLKFIKSNNVSVCFVTTALFNTLVDVRCEWLVGLRKLLFGGELVSESHVTKAFHVLGPSVLVHVYGPTETTVYATSFPINALTTNGTIPIGKPLTNTRALILDDDRQITGVGILGELYIGGDGVSLGYFNNPELTNNSFVFIENETGIWYRTGDIARWNDEGDIEFIGRRDNQIKIRGYRIELDEIENVVKKSPGIKQAIIRVHADILANKRIVAYVVPDSSYSREITWQYLIDKLPGYMVPNNLIELDALPLTSNGKVDTMKLPSIDHTRFETEVYVQPETELERVLVLIWENILGVHPIGVNDNFFELGGHSLLATKVTSAIRQKLNIEVEIRSLFIHQTVRILSSYLEKSGVKEALPAVTKRLEVEYPPLSFAQERLWFIHQLHGSVQYHIPWKFIIRGPVNAGALERSFKTVIRRHEILRTTIDNVNGVGYQKVNDSESWKLKISQNFNLSQEALNAYLANEIKKPFNLSQDFMLRAELLQFSHEESVLVGVMHHIASDGWSLSILIGEVMESYNSFTRDQQPNLKSLSIQYADYAQWQRNYLKGPLYMRQLKYWKDKLAGAVPTKLVSDFPRGLTQSKVGKTLLHRYGNDLRKKIDTFSHKENVSFFMTLLSAFNALLYKYTGQRDISIGTAIAGRRQQDLERLIGFFVNTLVIKSEVEKGQTFRDLLQKTKDNLLTAYEHQDIPFEKVVESIVGKRNADINPLFHIMFAFQNTPDLPELRLNDAILIAEPFDDGTSLFDFVFDLRDTESDLSLKLRYSTELFDSITMERFIDHYHKLLSFVISNPEHSVDDIDLLSAKDRSQIISNYNALPVYTSSNTIIELFENHVARTPDKTAVVFEQSVLTYDGLNRRANQLGWYLRNKDIGVDTIVPICVERSLELMICIIGVLKAGAAYLPIDPTYPADRVSFMLKDSSSKVILCDDTKYLHLCSNEGTEFLNVNELFNEITSGPTENLPTISSGRDLAYVMYTSGSTGKPKGILVSNDNVVSLVKGTSYGSLGEKDVLLSTGSPSFDASTFEYWGMLLNGGELILAALTTLLSDERLNEIIKLRGVNKIWFTAGFFNQLVDKSIYVFETLNRIFVGGEKLSEDHVRRLKEKFPRLDIVNGYGPTENTTFSLTYKIGQGDFDRQIPIGRALENRTAYILDFNRKLLPIGVTGELYVGGAGVARGYLNQPELTAERFVEDPFSPIPGSRMYKTGDLARWRSDGNIEYLGRIDDQVKVRGYRIELGEVESVLNSMRQISASCVVVKKDSLGLNSLVGYFVADAEVVKEKSALMYLKQLESWRTLYESEYGKTETSADVEEEFNIIGWNDSFTGKAIPEDQMREWLSDIVRVIDLDQTQEVLEIGCGTGLIYYALSEKVSKYIGTDLSNSSIRQIQNRISKRVRPYSPTTLFVCPAHELSLASDESIDTIIINSVVQYFPGADYLTKLVEKSIGILKGKGRIIIGDVRDHRLLKLFKGRLYLEKVQSGLSKREFEWGLNQEIMWEEELCFSPEYFYGLRAHYPEISHVDIQWKQGSHENELTLYRYTVVIHIGDVTAEPISWRDSRNTGMREELFREVETSTGLIGLKGVLNFRLRREFNLQSGLVDDEVMTTGDLLKHNLTDIPEMDLVKEIVDEALNKGYHTKFQIHEDPLKFNLVLSRHPIGNCTHQGYDHPAGSDDALSNNPLITEVGLELQREVREFLKNELPEYMTPSLLTVVPQLPLTANGKTDRNFLMERQDVNNAEGINHVSPRTEMEEKIASIWQELLDLNRISIHDNFFEIGGHSLLATRVVSMIRSKLLLEINVRDLFINCTIATLASHLEKSAKKATLEPIIREQRPENIPLSFAQERLWFIDKLQGSSHYNMPWVFTLEGNLDVRILELTFITILQRHEVLRTVFDESEGKPYQKIISEDRWRLSVRKDETLCDEEEWRQYVATQTNLSFDLASDYMMRAELVELKKQVYKLIIVFHHIAFDGWSMSIIVNEVVSLYRALLHNKPHGLNDLQIQYADYAIWQQRYLKSKIIEDQLLYWKNKLKGMKTLAIPTDFPKPKVQSIRGNTIYFLIKKSLRDDLEAVSRKQDVTLFVTMLSVFKILLFRYARQEDISVGVAIANRTKTEIEPLIGFFVNALVIRTSIGANMMFRDFLQHVKQATVEAYDNQDAPFEKVTEVVADKRDFVGRSLVQAMFVLQNLPDIPAIDFEGVRLVSELSENVTSKFDITFDLRVKDNGIEFRVEYCADLFESNTIKRMFAHYENLLTAVSQNVNVPIRSLKMMSDSESTQLLYDFNSK